MAWDTERTRLRLKEAAVTEFAENGFAGTKMTNIAARAGINKERLYSYFGNKRALWEHVLADELDALATAVEVRGVSLDDVGEFAGATYDYHADHPQLARLLQWEGLMGGPAADAQTRATHYREKVARFTQAQENGALTADLDAAHLVFALIALAAWWQTVPQLAELITATDNTDRAEQERRRAFVVAAAQRLAAAP